MEQLKSILLTAAMSLCVISAYAEQAEYETKHEIAVSYGTLSNSNYLSLIESTLPILYSVGHCYYDEKAFIGPIGAEYFYRLNKVFGVGGIGVFAMQNKDIMVDKKIGTSHEMFFTIMPALKADWLRRKYFGMYSKLALGTTIFSERHKYDDGDKQSTSAATVAWQASVLGIEAGSIKFRAFAEVGMGEQGVALVGLRYKF